MRLCAIALGAAALGCAPKASGGPPAAPVSEAPAERGPAPQLETAVPELARFEVVQTMEPPTWLAEGGSSQAWVRLGGQCQPLSLDHGPGRTHAVLPVCARKRRRRRVDCSLHMRLDAAFRVETLICNLQERDGSGVGKHVPTADDPGRLALIAADEDSVRYAPVFTPVIEPAAVQIREARCEAGSVERARAIVERRLPGATAAQLDRALMMDLGIRDGHQTCRKGSGYRMTTLRERKRRPRLAGGVDQIRESVDCTQPCPDDPISDHARRFSSAVRDQHRRDPDRPDLTVYRSEGSCTAALDDAPAQYLAIDPTTCDQL